MNKTFINVPINFLTVNEDDQYEHLIPVYPISVCTFDQIGQKCEELKQRLPGDIVDVYVPSKEEVDRLLVKITNCGTNWWTSSVSSVKNSPININQYGCDHINLVDRVDLRLRLKYGFRPIVVRRKHKNMNKNRINTINTPINFQVLKKDTHYEYLFPEYTFCSCPFNELEHNCKVLKQCLPEDVVKVYVPTLEEAMSLPEEIRECGDWWWTTTMANMADYYASTVHIFMEDGNLYYNDDFDEEYNEPITVYDPIGFRPIVVRRK